MELLRSKFKRSTQKLSFRLTDFDLDLKVDIEDQALGRQKMNWVKQLIVDLINLHFSFNLISLSNVN